jgi:hypothetical protein
MPDTSPARNRTRTRTLRSLLVAVCLAVGAVLLLTEVILMLMPPAVCQQPADITGGQPAARDVAAALPIGGTATAVMGQAGKGTAGRITIAIVIRIDEAGQITATDRAAGDHEWMSPLRVIQVPGTSAGGGAVREPARSCGMPRFVVAHLVTVQLEATLTVVASQPAGECSASPVSASPVTGRCP